MWTKIEWEHCAFQIKSVQLTASDLLPIGKTTPQGGTEHDSDDEAGNDDSEDSESHDEEDEDDMEALDANQAANITPAIGPAVASMDTSQYGASPDILS